MEFRLIDIAIWLVCVCGQTLLGRAVFHRRALRVPLLALWFCCAFSMIGQAFRGTPLTFVPAALRGVLYNIGTGWTFASATAMLCWWIATRASSGLRFSPDRRRVIGATAAVVPFAAVAFGAIIERSRFEVREIEFPVPGLHPDLEGFRIAQVTDLHVSPFLSVAEAARVVDMANELKPHLAVMTGDLISEKGDPLDDAIGQVARLQADYGVLGCLGNHEIYAGCEDYVEKEAGRRGVRFLRQAGTSISRGNAVLRVAGVDYQSFAHRRTYLAGSEQLIVPGATNLLLSHNPDVFPVAVAKGFDAMLSGHTHGGQVNVEILGRNTNAARFFTPWVLRLYRLNGRTAYVSPGIGTIGMPVRLGVPPEISLIRLTKA